MVTHRQPDAGPVAAVLFEPYGTLVDIETDERDWYAYLNLSRFLEYRGVRLGADELRWLWFEQTARQLAESAERYPDIDARAIWRELLARRAAPCRHMGGLDQETFVADTTALHRALTRRTLRLMEDVRPLLEALAGRVKLGVVTDSQPDYILPELQLTGLDRHMQTVVVSGEHGYRKPDPRLFAAALHALNVPAERALFVGVDTGRDVTGARTAGIRSVLVLTPYGSKDIALGEPDYVIDRPGELLPLLQPLVA
jgi:putative hydrolase of the HAD superfamily